MAPCGLRNQVAPSALPTQSTKKGSLQRQGHIPALDPESALQLKNTDVLHHTYGTLPSRGARVAVVQD